MPKLAPPTLDTVTLSDALAAWDRTLAAADKSPKTRRTYAYAGTKLAACVGRGSPLGSICRAMHEELFASLQADGMSPGSRVLVYRSLQTFWKWATAHPDMPVERNPMTGMQQPRVPEKVVEFVSDSELRAILATCQSRSRHNYRGRRDEAIIRTFAATGCRLAEVTNLTLEDVDLFASAIRVLGKGRRERWVPFDEGTGASLRLYLERERPRSSHAMSTDRVWLAPKGPMSDSGIAQMLAERGRSAGIARRVHPHELRHR